MVLTLFTWLLIGAGALIGLSFFNKEDDVPVIKPRPMRKTGPVTARKIQPGDVTYMQNASPYAYEPDGNLK